MVVLSPGWELDVERGPDWLIVTLHSDGAAEGSNPPLAQTVWSLLEQHFTYRVVLDLGQLSLMSTALIGQLVRLQKRICTHDGTLRLCGLSDHNLMVLRTCRLDGYFPIYCDREGAVMGDSPRLPR
jgi:anti-anti-sigma factor